MRPTLDRRTLLAAAPGLALAPVALAATPNPYGLLWSEGRYLPMIESLRADPSQVQQLAYRLATIGDERGAFAAIARSTPQHLVCPPLDGVRVRDAIDEIVERSAGRRVVILNETHYVSRDRVFAQALALRLRHEGFNWFAAEALNSKTGARKQAASTGVFVAEILPDDTWARPAGAVTFSSVDYADPCFAELIRGVRKAGYRTYAYEMQAQQSGDDSIAAREDAESANLAALLAAEPAARVFVYCGFGHVRKTAIGGERWMAARLRERSNIDPLCVEQAWGAPPPPGLAEDTALAMALDRLRPARPISATLSDGSPLTLEARMKGGVDISVLHPRLPDVAGRPGWLPQAPGRREVRTALRHGLPDGALAQAVPVDELALSRGAIPADQYPLRPDASEAVFFLSPGRYRIRIETIEAFEPVRDLTVA